MDFEKTIHGKDEATSTTHKNPKASHAINFLRYYKSIIIIIIILCLVPVYTYLFTLFVSKEKKNSSLFCLFQKINLFFFDKNSNYNFSKKFKL